MREIATHHAPEGYTAVKKQKKNSCAGCAFQGDSNSCKEIYKNACFCSGSLRSDSIDVIFQPIPKGDKMQIEDTIKAVATMEEAIKDMTKQLNLFVEHIEAQNKRIEEMHELTIETIKMIEQEREQNNEQNR